MEVYSRTAGKGKIKKWKKTRRKVFGV